MVGLGIIQKRFNELAEFAERVKRTSRPDCDGISTVVDHSLMTEWETSVQSLIEQAFGKDHPTCKRFQEGPTGMYAESESSFDQLHAVFRSAKSDFEGGYLFTVRDLVHAEVFSDELDQAKHFLDLNHRIPAAVIAGTVLETAARTLCEKHLPSVPAKLSVMNEELRKAGVYNQVVWRQIQGWADVRNAAAHGQPNGFEEDDVKLMIDGIRSFLANQIN
jgi:hypothetical protein